MSEPVADEQRILTERRGPVLIITINRPEARNAFDAACAEAMEAAVDRLDAEDDLFVGVITGAAAPTVTRAVAVPLPPGPVAVIV